MPIQTPNDKEKRSDYMERCMNSIMEEDDMTQDKAVAMCMKQWDEKEGVEKIPMEEAIKITIKD